MKAIEIKKTGGPEVLELKNITLDKPEPNEVTIEQKAIGLNYIDTYHRSGLYPLKLPIGLGLEGAGIVTKVGENVKNFNKGDRVVSNGKHAEVVNVPKNLCAKVPDTVSDEEASFTVLGAVALQGIRLAKPTLGETVLVICLGLVGLITV